MALSISNIADTKPIREVTQFIAKETAK